MIPNIKSWRFGIKSHYAHELGHLGLNIGDVIVHRLPDVQRDPSQSIQNGIRRMSRYDLPGDPEVEFEPNSDSRVLRNLLGITDPLEAEARETDLLAIAYRDSLEWAALDTQFSASIICEMHRVWLQELYPTAGGYRTVNLSKGGFPFCRAEFIAREMNRFGNEQLAAHTPCHGSRIQMIAASVAAVHAELLLIHPFREGNARLGRWLADLMILQAGFQAPAYDLSEEEKRARYFSAMRKGYAGDLKDLTALFESWILRAQ